MWQDKEVLRRDVKQRMDTGLSAALERRVLDALMDASFAAEETFGCDGFELDRQLVARYDAPGGHFAAHRDDVFPGTDHRKVALSVVLNEGFEGGEVLLPECGMTVRPPAGAALFFAASTLHQVAPVTAGRRFVYLTFLT